MRTRDDLILVMLWKWMSALGAELLHYRSSNKFANINANILQIAKLGLQMSRRLREMRAKAQIASEYVWSQSV
jgi:hypothetical protein